MKEKRIIISGGGTGGHLYPSLAVGQKLKEKDPHLLLTYVGSTRSLEKQISAHHKVKFIPLKIEGIKGLGVRALKSLLLLPWAFLRSLNILLRIKPDLVIGAGGYSSGPIVLLASWMKIPTLIMEQNIRPGLTNRLLLRWVKKAAVSFESSIPHFRGKGILTGNPVREEFYSLPPKQRNSSFTLLVFGGSQGSHFLNKGIVEALPFLKKEKASLKIFHQTGKNDLEWVRDSYRKNGYEDAVVNSYFFEMPFFFDRSDLIISRAGASTIAELIAARKASVLIPFARATEDHQLLNARELEKAGGASVIAEQEFSPEGFAETILHYAKNRDEIHRMEENLGKLKKQNAAEKISDLCFTLMEKTESKSLDEK
jgi:UDP-N-acetylglucosamine--N-acetylmuramyl-(pentapeptide) pyrophosphoryl-undecaprenol N-acetylglucosamine transferase